MERKTNWKKALVLVAVLSLLLVLLVGCGKTATEDFNQFVPPSTDSPSQGGGATGGIATSISQKTAVKLLYDSFVKAQADSSMNTNFLTYSFAPYITIDNNGVKKTVTLRVKGSLDLGKDGNNKDDSVFSFEVVSNQAGRYFADNKGAWVKDGNGYRLATEADKALQHYVKDELVILGIYGDGTTTYIDSRNYETGRVVHQYKVDDFDMAFVGKYIDKIVEKLDFAGFVTSNSLGAIIDELTAEGSIDPGIFDLLPVTLTGSVLDLVFSLIDAQNGCTVTDNSDGSMSLYLPLVLNSVLNNAATMNTLLDLVFPESNTISEIIRFVLSDVLEGNVKLETSIRADIKDSKFQKAAFGLKTSSKNGNIKDVEIGVGSLDLTASNSFATDIKNVVDSYKSSTDSRTDYSFTTLSADVDISVNLAQQSFTLGKLDDDIGNLLSGLISGATGWKESEINIAEDLEISLHLKLRAEIDLKDNKNTRILIELIGDEKDSITGLYKDVTRLGLYYDGSYAVEGAEGALYVDLSGMGGGKIMVTSYDGFVASDSGAWVKDADGYRLETPKDAGLQHYTIAQIKLNLKELLSNLLDSAIEGIPSITSLVNNLINGDASGASAASDEQNPNLKAVVDALSSGEVIVEHYATASADEEDPAVVEESGGIDVMGLITGLLGCAVITKGEARLSLQSLAIYASQEVIENIFKTGLGWALPIDKLNIVLKQTTGAEGSGYANEGWILGLELGLARDGKELADVGLEVYLNYGNPDPDFELPEFGNSYLNWDFFNRNEESGAFDNMYVSLALDGELAFTAKDQSELDLSPLGSLLYGLAIKLFAEDEVDVKLGFSIAADVEIMSIIGLLKDSSNLDIGSLLSSINAKIILTNNSTVGGVTKNNKLLIYLNNGVLYIDAPGIGLNTIKVDIKAALSDDFKLFNNQGSSSAVATEAKASYVEDSDSSVDIVGLIIAALAGVKLDSSGIEIMLVDNLLSAILSAINPGFDWGVAGEITTENSSLGLQLNGLNLSGLYIDVALNLQQGENNEIGVGLGLGHIKLTLGKGADGFAQLTDNDGIYDVADFAPQDEKTSAELYLESFGDIFKDTNLFIGAELEIDVELAQKSVNLDEIIGALFQDVALTSEIDIRNAIKGGLALKLWADVDLHNQPASNTTKLILELSTVKNNKLLLGLYYDATATWEDGTGKGVLYLNTDGMLIQKTKLEVNLIKGIYDLIYKVTAKEEAAPVEDKVIDGSTEDGSLDLSSLSPLLVMGDDGLKIQLLAGITDLVLGMLLGDYKNSIDIDNSSRYFVYNAVETVMLSDIYGNLYETYKEYVVENDKFVVKTENNTNDDTGSAREVWVKTDNYIALADLTDADATFAVKDQYYVLVGGNYVLITNDNAATFSDWKKYVKMEYMRVDSLTADLKMISEARNVLDAEGNLITLGMPELQKYVLLDDGVTFAAWTAENSVNNDPDSANYERKKVAWAKLDNYRLVTEVSEADAKFALAGEDNNKLLFVKNARGEFVAAAEGTTDSTYYKFAYKLASTLTAAEILSLIDLADLLPVNTYEKAFTYTQYVISNGKFVTVNAANEESFASLPKYAKLDNYVTLAEYDLLSDGVKQYAVVSTIDTTEATFAKYKWDVTQNTLGGFVEISAADAEKLDATEVYVKFKYKKVSAISGTEWCTVGGFAVTGYTESTGSNMTQYLKIEMTAEEIYSYKILTGTNDSAQIYLPEIGASVQIGTIVRDDAATENVDERFFGLAIGVDISSTKVEGAAPTVSLDIKLGRFKFTKPEAFELELNEVKTAFAETEAVNLANFSDLTVYLQVVGAIELGAYSNNPDSGVKYTLNNALSSFADSFHGDASTTTHDGGYAAFESSMSTIYTLLKDIIIKFNIADKISDVIGLRIAANLKVGALLSGDGELLDKLLAAISNSEIAIEIFSEEYDGTTANRVIGLYIQDGYLYADIDGHLVANTKFKIKLENILALFNIGGTSAAVSTEAKAAAELSINSIGELVEGILGGISIVSTETEGSLTIGLGANLLGAVIGLIAGVEGVNLPIINENNSFVRIKTGGSFETDAAGIYNKVYSVYDNSYVTADTLYVKVAGNYVEYVASQHNDGNGVPPQLFTARYVLAADYDITDGDREMNGANVVTYKKVNTKDVISIGLGIDPVYLEIRLGGIEFGLAADDVIIDEGGNKVILADDATYKSIDDLAENVSLKLEIALDLGLKQGVIGLGEIISTIVQAIGYDINIPLNVEVQEDVELKLSIAIEANLNLNDLNKSQLKIAVLNKAYEIDKVLFTINLDYYMDGETAVPVLYLDDGEGMKSKVEHFDMLDSILGKALKSVIGALSDDGASGTEAVATAEDELLDVVFTLEEDILKINISKAILTTVVGLFVPAENVTEDLINMLNGLNANVEVALDLAKEDVPNSEIGISIALGTQHFNLGLAIKGLQLSLSPYASATLSESEKATYVAAAEVEDQALNIGFGLDISYDIADKVADLSALLKDIADSESLGGSGSWTIANILKALTLDLVSNQAKGVIGIDVVVNIPNNLKSKLVDIATALENVLMGALGYEVPESAFNIIDLLYEIDLGIFIDLNGKNIAISLIDGEICFALANIGADNFKIGLGALIDGLSSSASTSEAVATATDSTLSLVNTILKNAFSSISIVRGTGLDVALAPQILGFLFSNILSKSLGTTFSTDTIDLFTLSNPYVVSTDLGELERFDTSEYVRVTDTRYVKINPKFTSQLGPEKLMLTAQREYVLAEDGEFVRIEGTYVTYDAAIHTADDIERYDLVDMTARMYEWNRNSALHDAIAENLGKAYIIENNNAWVEYDEKNPSHEKLDTYINEVEWVLLDDFTSADFQEETVDGKTVCYILVKTNVGGELSAEPIKVYLSEIYAKVLNKYVLYNSQLSEHKTVEKYTRLNTTVEPKYVRFNQYETLHENQTLFVEVPVYTEYSATEPMQAGLAVYALVGGSIDENGILNGIVEEYNEKDANHAGRALYVTQEYVEKTYAELTDILGDYVDAAKYIFDVPQEYRTATEGYDGELYGFHNGVYYLFDAVDNRFEDTEGNAVPELAIPVRYSLVGSEYVAAPDGAYVGIVETDYRALYALVGEEYVVYDRTIHGEVEVYSYIGNGEYAIYEGATRYYKVAHSGIFYNKANGLGIKLLFTNGFSFDIGLDANATMTGTAQPCLPDGMNKDDFVSIDNISTEGMVYVSLMLSLQLSGTDNSAAEKEVELGGLLSSLLGKTLGGEEVFDTLGKVLLQIEDFYNEVNVRVSIGVDIAKLIGSISGGGDLLQTILGMEIAIEIMEENLVDVRSGIYLYNGTLYIDYADEARGIFSVQLADIIGALAAQSAESQAVATGEGISSTAMAQLWLGAYQKGIITGNSVTGKGIAIFVTAQCLDVLLDTLLGTDLDLLGTLKMAADDHVAEITINLGENGVDLGEFAIGIALQLSTLTIGINIGQIDIGVAYVGSYVADAVEGAEYTFRNSNYEVYNEATHGTQVRYDKVDAGDYEQITESNRDKFSGYTKTYTYVDGAYVEYVLATHGDQLLYRRRAGNEDGNGDGWDYYRALRGQYTKVGANYVLYDADVHGDLNQYVTDCYKRNDNGNYTQVNGVYVTYNADIHGDCRLYVAGAETYYQVGGRYVLVSEYDEAINGVRDDDKTYRLLASSERKVVPDIIKLGYTECEENYNGKEFINLDGKFVEYNPAVHGVDGLLYVYTGGVYKEFVSAEHGDATKFIKLGNNTFVQYDEKAHYVKPADGTGKYESLVNDEIIIDLSLNLGIIIEMHEFEEDKGIDFGAYLNNLLGNLLGDVVLPEIWFNVPGDDTSVGINVNVALALNLTDLDKTVAEIKVTGQVVGEQVFPVKTLAAIYYKDGEVLIDLSGLGFGKLKVTGVRLSDYLGNSGVDLLQKLFADSSSASFAEASEAVATANETAATIKLDGEAVQINITNNMVAWLVNLPVLKYTLSPTLVDILGKLGLNAMVEIRYMKAGTGDDGEHEFGINIRPALWVNTEDVKDELFGINISLNQIHVGNTGVVDRVSKVAIDDYDEYVEAVRLNFAKNSAGATEIKYEIVLETLSLNLDLSVSALIANGTYLSEVGGLLLGALANNGTSDVLKGLNVAINLDIRMAELMALINRMTADGSAIEFDYDLISNILPLLSAQISVTSMTTNKEVVGIYIVDGAVTLGLAGIGMPNLRLDNDFLLDILRKVLAEDTDNSEAVATGLIKDKIDIGGLLGGVLQGIKLEERALQIVLANDYIAELLGSLLNLPDGTIEDLKAAIPFTERMSGLRLNVGNLTDANLDSNVDPENYENTQKQGLLQIDLDLYGIHANVDLMWPAITLNTDNPIEVPEYQNVFVLTSDSNELPLTLALRGQIKIDENGDGTPLGNIMKGLVGDLETLLVVEDVIDLRYEICASLKIGFNISELQFEIKNLDLMIKLTKVGIEDDVVVIYYNSDDKALYLDISHFFAQQIAATGNETLGKLVIKNIDLVGLLGGLLGGLGSSTAAGSAISDAVATAGEVYGDQNAIDNTGASPMVYVPYDAAISKARTQFVVVPNMAYEVYSASNPNHTSDKTKWFIKNDNNEYVAYSDPADEGKVAYVYAQTRKYVINRIDATTELFTYDGSTYTSVGAAGEYAGTTDALYIDVNGTKQALYVRIGSRYMAYTNASAQEYLACFILVNETVYRSIVVNVNEGTALDPQWVNYDMGNTAHSTLTKSYLDNDGSYKPVDAEAQKYVYFVYEYVLYNAGDAAHAGLTRYNLVDNVYTENESGSYVLIERKYVKFNAIDPTHIAPARYMKNDSGMYVVDVDGTYVKMPLYEYAAIMTFATEVFTEGKLTEDSFSLQLTGVLVGKLLGLLLEGGDDYASLIPNMYIAINNDPIENYMGIEIALLDEYKDYGKALDLQINIFGFEDEGTEKENFSNLKFEYTALRPSAIELEDYRTFASIDLDRLLNASQITDVLLESIAFGGENDNNEMLYLNASIDVDGKSPEQLTDWTEYIANILGLTENELKVILDVNYTNIAAEDIFTNISVDIAAAINTKNLLGGLIDGTGLNLAGTELQIVITMDSSHLAEQIRGKKIYITIIGDEGDGQTGIYIDLHEWRNKGKHHLSLNLGSLLGGLGSSSALATEANYGMLGSTFFGILNSIAGEIRLADGRISIGFRDDFLAKMLNTFANMNIDESTKSLVTGDLYIDLRNLGLGLDINFGGVTNNVPDIFLGLKIGGINLAKPANYVLDDTKQGSFLSAAEKATYNNLLETALDIDLSAQISYESTETGAGTGFQLNEIFSLLDLAGFDNPNIAIKVADGGISDDYFIDAHIHLNLADFDDLYITLEVSRMEAGVKTLRLGAYIDKNNIYVDLSAWGLPKLSINNVNLGKILDDALGGLLGGLSSSSDGAVATASLEDWKEEKNLLIGGGFPYFSLLHRDNALAIGLNGKLINALIDAIGSGLNLNIALPDLGDIALILDSQSGSLVPSLMMKIKNFLLTLSLNDLHITGNIDKRNSNATTDDDVEVDWRRAKDVFDDVDKSDFVCAYDLATGEIGIETVNISADISLAIDGTNDKDGGATKYLSALLTSLFGIDTAAVVNANSKVITGGDIHLRASLNIKTLIGALTGMGGDWWNEVGLYLSLVPKGYTDDLLTVLKAPGDSDIYLDLSGILGIAGATPETAKPARIRLTGLGGLLGSAVSTALRGGAATSSLATDGNASAIYSSQMLTITLGQGNVSIDIGMGLLEAVVGLLGDTLATTSYEHGGITYLALKLGEMTIPLPRLSENKALSLKLNYPNKIDGLEISIGLDAAGDSIAIGISDITIDIEQTASAFINGGNNYLAPITGETNQETWSALILNDVYGISIINIIQGVVGAIDLNASINYQKLIDHYAHADNSTGGLYNEPTTTTIQLYRSTASGTHSEDSQGNVLYAGKFGLEIDVSGEDLQQTRHIAAWLFNSAVYIDIADLISALSPILGAVGFNQYYVTDLDIVGLVSGIGGGEEEETIEVETESANILSTISNFIAGIQLNWWYDATNANNTNISTLRIDLNPEGINDLLCSVYYLLYSLYCDKFGTWQANDATAEEFKILTPTVRRQIVDGTYPNKGLGATSDVDPNTNKSYRCVDAYKHSVYYLSEFAALLLADLTHMGILYGILHPGGTNLFGSAWVLPDVIGGLLPIPFLEAGRSSYVEIVFDKSNLANGGGILKELGIYINKEKSEAISQNTAQLVLSIGGINFRSATDWTWYDGEPGTGTVPALPTITVEDAFDAVEISAASLEANTALPTRAEVNFYNNAVYTSRGQINQEGTEMAELGGTPISWDTSTVKLEPGATSYMYGYALNQQICRVQVNVTNMSEFNRLYGYVNASGKFVQTNRIIIDPTADPTASNASTVAKLPDTIVVMRRDGILQMLYTDYDDGDVSQYTSVRIDGIDYIPMGKFGWIDPSDADVKAGGKISVDFWYNAGTSNRLRASASVEYRNTNITGVIIDNDSIYGILNGGTADDFTKANLDIKGNLGVRKVHGDDCTDIKDSYDKTIYEDYADSDGSIYRFYKNEYTDANDVVHAALTFERIFNNAVIGSGSYYIASGAADGGLLSGLFGGVTESKGTYVLNAVTVNIADAGIFTITKTETKDEVVTPIECSFDFVEGLYTYVMTPDTLFDTTSTGKFVEYYNGNDDDAKLSTGTYVYNRDGEQYIFTRKNIAVKQTEMGALSAGTMTATIGNFTYTLTPNVADDGSAGTQTSNGTFTIAAGGTTLISNIYQYNALATGSAYYLKLGAVKYDAMGIQGLNAGNIVLAGYTLTPNIANNTTTGGTFTSANGNGTYEYNATTFKFELKYDVAGDKNKITAVLANGKTVELDVIEWNFDDFTYNMAQPELGASGTIGAVVNLYETSLSGIRYVVSNATQTIDIKVNISRYELNSLTDGRVYSNQYDKLFTATDGSSIIDGTRYYALVENMEFVEFDEMNPAHSAPVKYVFDTASEEYVVYDSTSHTGMTVYVYVNTGSVIAPTWEYVEYFGDNAVHNYAPDQYVYVDINPTEEITDMCYVKVTDANKENYSGETKYVHVATAEYVEYGTVGYEVNAIGEYIKVNNQYMPYTSGAMTRYNRVINTVDTDVYVAAAEGAFVFANIGSATRENWTYVAYNAEEHEGYARYNKINVADMAITDYYVSELLDDEFAVRVMTSRIKSENIVFNKNELVYYNFTSVIGDKHRSFIVPVFSKATDARFTVSAAYSNGAFEQSFDITTVYTAKEAVLASSYVQVKPAGSITDIDTFIGKMTTVYFTDGMSAQVKILEIEAIDIADFTKVGTYLVKITIGVPTGNYFDEGFVQKDVTMEIRVA